MKIKTTQIIKKLQPNAADFLVRVKNQQKLFNELVRRLEWKLVVLDHCDNYDEFSRATRIREFKAKENFDLEHHAVNRADRRRIKAEYRRKKKEERDTYDTQTTSPKSYQSLLRNTKAERLQTAMRRRLPRRKKNISHRASPHMAHPNIK